MKEYINLVPTSAIKGEVLPNLMRLLIYLAQNYLIRKIAFKEEVRFFILEVKVLKSIDTTIDVILFNGSIHIGDKIVIWGLFGSIKASVNIILLSKSIKEVRVVMEFQVQLVEKLFFHQIKKKKKKENIALKY